MIVAGISGCIFSNAVSRMIRYSLEIFADFVVALTCVIDGMGQHWRMRSGVEAVDQGLELASSDEVTRC